MENTDTSKHKIGDIVTIRSWDSMVEEFGVDFDGSIKVPGRFLPEMRYLCNGTYQIDKCTHTDTGEVYYLLDGHMWQITEKMLTTWEKKNAKSTKHETNVNTLETNILAWAKERGILDNSSAKDQMLKCVEEVGETARAILKNNVEDAKDGIGDTIVTLIIVAAHLNTDIGQCLDMAYNTIKSRKGKMVNGAFVKEV